MWLGTLIIFILTLLFSPKPQFSIGLLWFWREEQNSEFSKSFLGGYLFVFVEYLCDRSSKIETKNTKNYSSILAIVNHRNWLDDLPPLITTTGRLVNLTIKIVISSLAPIVRLLFNKKNLVDGAMQFCFSFDSVMWFESFVVLVISLVSFGFDD